MGPCLNLNNCSRNAFFGFFMAMILIHSIILWAFSYGLMLCSRTLLQDLLMMLVFGAVNNTYSRGCSFKFFPELICCGASCQQLHLFMCAQGLIVGVLFIDGFTLVFLMSWDFNFDNWLHLLGGVLG